MQAQTFARKVAGRRGQRHQRDSSELQFFSGLPGPDREATEEADVDRERGQGCSGARLHEELETDLGGHSHDRRHPLHGQRSRSGLVL